jgi:hypothetical protein
MAPTQGQYALDPTIASIDFEWNANPGEGLRLREAYFREKDCWPPPKRVSPAASAAALQRFNCLLRRGRRSFRCHNGHPLIGF